MTSHPGTEEPSGSNPGASQPAGQSASLTSLAHRIDAIDASLRARAAEAQALAPLIERIVNRVGEIRDLVGGLQPQIAQATVDIQALRDQQEKDAESLRDTRIRLLEREREQQAVPEAVERLAQIERRLDELTQRMEIPLPATTERLGQLETLVDALAHGQHSLPAALSRLDKMEASLEAPAEAGHATERRVAARTSLEAAAGGVPAETGLTQPGASGDDEGLLQVLRQESVGIAMASVNDLYRRVDQLDRQEEALSRIINLVVERSKLIAEEDLERERTQGSVRGRRGSR